MLALPFFALVLPIVALASSGCTDPAIVSAHAAPANGANGEVDHYDVAITVRNRGSRPQPASLLQSVAIYQDGSKVGQDGVEPLAAGASQTVHYRFVRATGARPGTTNLRFVLVLNDPHMPVTACSSAGHDYRLSV